MDFFSEKRKKCIAWARDIMFESCCNQPSFWRSEAACLRAVAPNHHFGDQRQHVSELLEPTFILETIDRTFLELWQPTFILETRDGTFESCCNQPSLVDEIAVWLCSALGWNMLWEIELDISITHCREGINVIFLARHIHYRNNCLWLRYRRSPARQRGSRNLSLFYGRVHV